MSNNVEKNLNTKSQFAFCQRMRRTHNKRHIWIDKETDQKLLDLAIKKGWVSTTGRNAGKANIQDTINKVLEAGLLVLKN